MSDTEDRRVGQVIVVCRACNAMISTLPLKDGATADRMFEEARVLFARHECKPGAA